jgi:4-hydroxy-tetrahydrodipicolinate synthase
MRSVAEIRNRWRGIVIPLVTPFQANGELDVAALRQNVRWLLDRGAALGNTVFLVGGSGGDFTVMTLAERLQIIETVTEVVAGQVPIIAGAQSCDIRDCIAIGQRCAELGVDAIQISGPYYYDLRPDDLLAWFIELGRQVDVGFALYNHYYSGSKYDIPIDMVEELLKLPSSVAVKWSSSDISKFYEGLQRFLPQVTVVDNTFLMVEAHLRGCRAFVSHIPNFCPEFTWHIWSLLEDGHYQVAHECYDAFMTPYSQVVGQIAASTSGEGVFVRPFMAAVGLVGGASRLPSRDAVVTPALQHEITALVALAHSLLVDK